MTPSARIHTGRMQIFFGGSAVFGTRGQHVVDFPVGEFAYLCHIYVLEFPPSWSSNLTFGGNTQRYKKPTNSICV